jgi:hypothetical protein
MSDPLIAKGFLFCLSKPFHIINGHFTSNIVKSTQKVMATRENVNFQTEKDREYLLE